MKELFKMTETVVSKDKCNFYRYMVMQDKEFDKAKCLPEVLGYEKRQKEKKRDIRSKKGSRKNNKKKKSKTPKMPSGELDNTGVWDVLKKLDLDD